MAAERGRVDAYRAVGEAVLAGDPAAARDNAHRLLEPATTALLEALHTLEEPR
jgi:DNA-binding FadR family transcriptional regulator